MLMSFIWVAAVVGNLALLHGAYLKGWISQRTGVVAFVTSLVLAMSQILFWATN